MYDIISVGEILTEILAENINQVFYKPGGRLLGPYASGAPAIAIDQAARMGAKTALIARVGKDDFGRLNRERLAGDGVDISGVLDTPGNSTGVAFVTYFDDGSRQFIYHFSKAACGELCPADVNEDMVMNSKCIHIMGCSITASPTLCEAIMHAVRLAARNGIKVSFDPNIRPEVLYGKIMDYYREIFELCDVLLTGKSELKTLYGNPDEGVKKLLEEKDRIVVVKDGSRGTNVYTRDDAFSVPVYPANEVDPTGAGDSFDGTFLAMMLNGADLRTAARYGNAAGAKAVEKRGPMEGNIFKSDLEAFMAQVGPVDIKSIPNPYKA